MCGSGDLEYPILVKSWQFVVSRDALFAVAERWRASYCAGDSRSIMAAIYHQPALSAETTDMCDLYVCHYYIMYLMFTTCNLQNPINEALNGLA